MKVTYNWLKDFVDIRLRPEELADKLTMAGLEVKAIEPFEDDFVYEIEITSNRPDWLSVIGVAREAAAITKSKVKSPKSKVQFKIQNQKEEDPPFKITVEDKKACPLYSARVIRDVQVGPSPEWMARRLKAIGLRSVNNVVDITNYVLYTTGQPLHAFDWDKISSRQSTRAPEHRIKIIIRKAKEGEEIVTIDGIKRKLSPEVLVIADEAGPIAIAGIMGGESSEVSKTTRNILLESAYFDPLSIRKGSRLLALSSDSSYRFERSVERGNVLKASDWAAMLIEEYAGGSIGYLYRSGSSYRSRKKSVSLDLSASGRLLGREISLFQARAVFKTLGFSVVSPGRGVLRIAPPDFRQDINQEVDLIEELGRVLGYENIPLTLPAIKPQAVKEDILLSIQEKIKVALSGLGYQEIISYSLLSQETLNKAALGAEAVLSLENPLSSQQEVLRPGLIAGLLSAFARNLELGNKIRGLFEIGDCFLSEREFRTLGLIEENGILELKGKLELLLERLGVKDYRFSGIQSPLFAPGQAAALLISGQEIGWIGQIDREALKGFKIECPQIVSCQLDLDKLKSRINFQRSYHPLPKYPAITRDLSLILDEGITYQEVLETLKALDLKELEAVKLKDVYRSQELGRGRKSITISLEFRSGLSTLTDNQVNSFMEKLTLVFSRNFGTIRS